MGTNEAILDDRNWHFVYIQWNASAQTFFGSMKIFIDGFLRETYIICSGCWYETGMDYNNIGNLLIGKNANQKAPLFYKGFLDELRIYNRPLSDTEIHELYINHCPPLVLEAFVDIDPNTLNKKSKGNWVTCYIELPEGNNAHDIDINTVELGYDSQKISAERDDVQGNLLMVKFSRQGLISILGSVTGNVELKVTGKVADTPFEGADTIKVK